MTISSAIIAIFLGLAFGFSLNKAGLTSYHNIANQFRFTDMTILKYMITAIVTAMIGLYIFRGLGWVTFPTVPATYVVGNLIGGLIFGVGMAGAGY
jgi:glutaredoxin-related protein